MSYKQKTQAEWDKDRKAQKAKASKAQKAATVKAAEDKIEALKTALAEPEKETVKDSKPVESITSDDVGGAPVPVIKEVKAPKAKTTSKSAPKKEA